MNIQLNPEVLKELEYMVSLHQQFGAPAEMQSVESLVVYVMNHIADGSRRPGSWERSLLQMLGLVANCDEHLHYRSHYGKAPSEEL